MQPTRGNIIIRVVLLLSTASTFIALGDFSAYSPFFYATDRHASPAGGATTRTLILSEDNNIITKGGYDVETLVRDIFVKGGCENVSNIRASGHRDGIGYFERGQSTIGLAGGVILATGNIKNAEGPNHVTDASSFFDVGGSDQDLRQMATDQLFDPVGLEFDFVPLDSFVTFRYVFASEEYCEFVGSIYNDVFGFFISGPGIEGGFSAGAKNVALIPGSEDEVSINNVNHRANEAYFIQNYLSNDARSCGIQFQPSPHIGFIEYDGFTQPMVASLKLIPCETYHIRLVISDVGDGFFDSAVFLEAGSFNIGDAVTVRGEVVADQDLTEGCSEGYLVFEREDLENLDYPVSVHFKVSPSGTAEEGVDFEPLPKTIHIPPGEAFARIPVYAINDGVREGRESLIVELDIPCSCYRDSAILYIDDPPLMAVQLPEAVVCQSGEAQLAPHVQGGVPPFSYRWEDGSKAALRAISAEGPTVFRVTVTDQCGVEAADSSFLRVNPPPQAHLEGYAQICAGDTAYFNLSFTGEPPWSFSYRRDDQLYEPQTEIFTNPYQLAVVEAGSYELVDFSDGHCRGEISGSAELAVWNIEVEADVQANTCYELRDGRIQIRISGGSPPYGWKWDHGLENIAELNDLAAGAYQLQVEDQNGCVRAYRFDLVAPDPLEEIRFDCEALRQSSIVLSAGGGVPPYRYSTDGHDFYDETLFGELDPGENYHLYIADANDCRLEQDLTMPAPYKTMATLPAAIDLKLGSMHQLKPALNIPESLLANVRWAPGDHLSCVNCLEPEIQAWEDITYTLHLIDIFGCSDEAKIRVNIDRSIDLYVPNVFSPNRDGINDRFVIYGNAVQIRQVLSLHIYDRWGTLLFQAHNFAVNDEAMGWDGHFRGQLMNAGAYVYQVQLELIDGTTQMRSGPFSLMR